MVCGCREVKKWKRNVMLVTGFKLKCQRTFCLVNKAILNILLVNYFGIFLTKQAWQD